MGRFSKRAGGRVQASHQHAFPRDWFEVKATAQEAPLNLNRLGITRLDGVLAGRGLGCGNGGILGCFFWVRRRATGSRGGSRRFATLQAAGLEESR